MPGLGALALMGGEGVKALQDYQSKRLDMQAKVATLAANKFKLDAEGRELQDQLRQQAEGGQFLAQNPDYGNFGAMMGLPGTGQPQGGGQPPTQGQPGGSVPQMPRPPMTPGGPAFGSRMAAGGPMPSQAPAAPQGAPPSPGGQSGGMNMPQQGWSLGQIAQMIAKSNPGIPPGDLFKLTMQFAGQQQQSLNPYDRMMATMFAASIKNQGAQDVANTRAEASRDVAKIGAGSREQMTRERIQAAMGKADASGGPLDPETSKFLGQAMLAGDNQTIQLALGFTRNRPQILAQIRQAAQEIDPSFTGQKAAGAVAQFGGMKTAAGTVGRTAGAVAVGAEEIPKLAPIIADVAGRLEFSQFPTVNAVEQAVLRGTGDADIVQLNSYIQSMKNAYQLISSRGGRMTDKQREQGDALIKGTMPLNQLAAAAQAMVTEAGVVKGATGAAMQDVTGGNAGGSASGGWSVQRVQ